MNDILDFWQHKHLYTEDIIEQKMIDFYHSDFIENYSKWKNNVDDLNRVAIEDLQSVNFPMEYWKELSYDDFCKRWINLLSEWIQVNKNIERKDIKVIYDKLFTEFIAERLIEWRKQMFTVDHLLESIKKPLMIKDAEY